MTLEISFAFAIALGSLLGGQLLKRRSWIGGSEIRNYSATFILGLVCSTISILWTIFRIKTNPVTSEEQLSIVNSEVNGEVEIQDENANEGEKQEKKQSFAKFILVEVLNPKRAIEAFKAVVAKREPGLRVQMILLMIAHIAIQLELIGMYKILFSYTQRMYFWNFEMYSFVLVITTVSTPVVSMVLIPFLSKIMKWSDIEMGLFGIVSSILSTLCAGSILSPLGFYLRILFASFGQSATVSIRSKMSKIVHADEATKVFAAMTSIEVFCPFISAVIYTNVYNATIANYPSLFIQMSTVTLLVPFFIFIFIDLKYERVFHDRK